MLDLPAVDRVFHALGDPSRRAIVERLSRGSTSATELAKPLPISLAAVVQHLQILEACGLVRTEKVGRTRTCHLDAEGLRLAEAWLEERRALWARRFDRLGELLTPVAQEESDP